MFVLLCFSNDGMHAGSVEKGGIHDTYCLMCCVFCCFMGKSPPYDDKKAYPGVNERANFVMQPMMECQKHVPEEHWYVFAIGALPEARGRSLSDMNNLIFLNDNHTVLTLNMLVLSSSSSLFLSRPQSKIDWIQYVYFYIYTSIYVSIDEDISHCKTDINSRLPVSPRVSPCLPVSPAFLSSSNEIVSEQ